MRIAYLASLHPRPTRASQPMGFLGGTQSTRADRTLGLVTTSDRSRRKRWNERPRRRSSGTDRGEEWWPRNRGSISCRMRPRNDRNRCQGQVGMSEVEIYAVCQRGKDGQASILNGHDSWADLGCLRQECRVCKGS